MEGRVDRIYGRCMRRGMGMRGFDGSKHASKHKAELSIETSLSSGVIRKTSEAD